MQTCPPRRGVLYLLVVDKYQVILHEKRKGSIRKADAVSKTRQGRKGDCQEKGSGNVVRLVRLQVLRK